MGIFVKSKLQEEYDELRIVRVWSAQSPKFVCELYSEKFPWNLNKFKIEQEQTKEKGGEKVEFSMCEFIICFDRSLSIQSPNSSEFSCCRTFLEIVSINC